MADLPPANNEAHSGRPRRVFKPSAALRSDPTQAGLPSQRQATTDFLTAEREKRAAAAAALTQPDPATHQVPITVNHEHESPPPALPSSKRAYVEDVEDVEDEDVEDEDEDGVVRENARINPKPKCEYFVI